MAELLKKSINEHSLYAIWQITESREELESAIQLREKEEELYRSFVAESRKKQWLAYRLLIRNILWPNDFPVEYDEHGKPYLAGSDMHISVTHSGPLAAVILSQRSRVGIDIEAIKPRVGKVKDKFLSTKELAEVDKERELEVLTTAWCAKEALYKLYGIRNLDFRENISIEVPAFAGQSFAAEIRIDDNTDRYTVYSERTGDFILVYVVDEPN